MKRFYQIKNDYTTFNYVISFYKEYIIVDIRELGSGEISTSTYDIDNNCIMALDLPECICKYINQYLKLKNFW